MRIVALAFLFTLLPLAQGQSDDPRLKTPVSVRERFMTLGEFGELVAKTSKLKVEVDKKIAERKVTIYCEDKPLGEIMERVATTLFLEWKPNAKGFKLELAKGVEDEEKSLKALVERVRDDARRRQIQAIIGLSKTPLSSLRKEAQQLTRSVPELRQNPSEESKALVARWDLIHSVESTRTLWDLGCLLSQASDQDLQRFMNGEWILGGTFHYTGLLKLERGAANPFYTADAPNNQAAIMAIHLDPRSEQISHQVRTQPTPNSTFDDGQKLTSGIGISSEWDQNAFERNPLVKRLSSFANDDKSGVFSATITRQGQLPKASFDDAWTMADRLLAVHDRTHVPIVADGVRLQVGWWGEPAPITIGEWTRSAGRFYDDSPNGQWASYRAEKGWLLVKDKNYVFDQENELPEKSMRKFEAKKATAGNLDIDDYAELASLLKPTQEEAFSELVTTFELSPIRLSAAELRLWNLLGAKTRAQASSKGVPVGSLSGSSQRALFALIQRTGMFTTLSWDLIPYFLPGGPAAPSDLRLSILDTRILGQGLKGTRQAPMHLRKNADISLFFGECAFVGAKLALYQGDQEKWSKTIQIGDTDKKPK